MIIARDPTPRSLSIGLRDIVMIQNLCLIVKQNYGNVYATDVSGEMETCPL